MNSGKKFLVIFSIFSCKTQPKRSDNLSESTSFGGFFAVGHGFSIRYISLTVAITFLLWFLLMMVRIVDMTLHWNNAQTFNNNNNKKSLSLREQMIICLALSFFGDPSILKLSQMPNPKLVNTRSIKAQFILWMFRDFFALSFAFRSDITQNVYTNILEIFSVVRVHKIIVNQHHFDIIVNIGCFRLFVSAIGRAAGHPLATCCHHHEIDEIVFSFIAFNDKNLSSFANRQLSVLRYTFILLYRSFQTFFCFSLECSM